MSNSNDKDDNDDGNKILNGIKVIEMAGLAPAPYCGMVLADFGANVVRVDRVVDGIAVGQPIDQLARGKQSIAIDLKKEQGRELLADLIAKSDVLIDCYRPGVLEKLGLSPSKLIQRNPRLIIARLTGFGQHGPYANMAGHDINYIALSGALSLFGRSNESPIYPANLLGDFAAGGLLCAFGIILALFNRFKTGKGKIIDSAMMDGSSYLSTFVYKLKEDSDGNGLWDGERGTNMLDTGAHYYEVYQTLDKKYVSVGAIEPQFYIALLKGLSLDNDTSLPDQNDKTQWPRMKQLFKRIFETKTRDEWESIFINTDACVAPVLEMNELSIHPHTKHRQLIQSNQFDNNSNISPSPRFFNPHQFNNNQNNQNNNNEIKLIKPIQIQSRECPLPGQHTINVLLQMYSIPSIQIDQLLNQSIIVQYQQSKL